MRYFNRDASALRSLFIHHREMHLSDEEDVHTRVRRRRARDSRRAGARRRAGVADDGPVQSAPEAGEALQAQVKALEKRVPKTRSTRTCFTLPQVSSISAFGYEAQICEQAVIADAFQGTWNVIDQIFTATQAGKDVLRCADADLRLASRAATSASRARAGFRRPRPRVLVPRQPACQAERTEPRRRAPARPRLLRRRSRTRRRNEEVARAEPSVPRPAGPSRAEAS